MSKVSCYLWHQTFTALVPVNKTLRSTRSLGFFLFLCLKWQTDNSPQSLMKTTLISSCLCISHLIPFLPWQKHAGLQVWFRLSVLGAFPAVAAEVTCFSMGRIYKSFYMQSSSRISVLWTGLLWAGQLQSFSLAPPFLCSGRRGRWPPAPLITLPKLKELLH